MTTVSLVGSTGSIGTQAVDVVLADPDRFEVVALGAHRSVDLLAEQARRLHPKQVAIGDESLAPALHDAVPAGTSSRRAAARDSSAMATTFGCQRRACSASRSTDVAAPRATTS